MFRSSPFRSTLNTGYIKLWTCVALDQCKLWTPFGHFCPYFHTPYTLLCPKDDFTFTFRRGLIWKIDNPSTTLSLAPGIFDNPYKGAESAGCQKQPLDVQLKQLVCWHLLVPSLPRVWEVVQSDNYGNEKLQSFQGPNSSRACIESLDFKRKTVNKDIMSIFSTWMSLTFTVKLKHRVLDWLLSILANCPSRRVHNRNLAV